MSFFPEDFAADRDRDEKYRRLSTLLSQHLTGGPSSARASSHYILLNTI